MGKLDALWEYHQAERQLDALDAKLRSTPARQKLNKLHSFLSEQQAQIANLQKQMEARKGTLNRLSAQFGELEHKYELEVSEFDAMENDPDCTAAEMTESRKSLEDIMEQLSVAKRDIFDTITWIEKATKEYKETFSKAGKAKRNMTPCGLPAKRRSPQPNLKSTRPRPWWSSARPRWTPPCLSVTQP